MSITDIWLIGDSLVSHLEDSVSGLRLPAKAGIVSRILFQGKGGMHWVHFDTVFQRLMLFHATPMMIIIHLGGNDLVEWSQSKLLKTFKRQFAYMASVYPEAQLVWSDILPRQSWRGADNTPERLKKLDQKRRRINRLGRQVAFNVDGKAIQHELDFNTTGLFKMDGVHLTAVGNAIFFNTFEEAINLFVTDPSSQMYNPNS